MTSRSDTPIRPGCVSANRVSPTRSAWSNAERSLSAPQRWVRRSFKVLSIAHWSTRGTFMGIGRFASKAFAQSGQASVSSLQKPNSVITRQWMPHQVRAGLSGSRNRVTSG